MFRDTSFKNVEACHHLPLLFSIRSGFISCFKLLKKARGSWSLAPIYVVPVPVTNWNGKDNSLVKPDHKSRSVTDNQNRIRKSPAYGQLLPCNSLQRDSTWSKTTFVYFFLLKLIHVQGYQRRDHFLRGMGRGCRPHRKRLVSKRTLKRRCTRRLFTFYLPLWTFKAWMKTAIVFFTFSGDCQTKIFPVIEDRHLQCFPCFQFCWSCRWTFGKNFEYDFFLLL